MKGTLGFSSCSCPSTLTACASPDGALQGSVPAPSVFSHFPWAGNIAVLFCIAVSCADLGSVFKSTINKIGSCAIDSVQL